METAETIKPSATLGLDESARRIWDAAVVGAGPAGAMAAYALARRGASVLLVDRAAFPRRKVCGSYFNKRALTILGEENLGHLMSELGAQPARRFLVYAGSRQLNIPIHEGAILSRKTFDAALVSQAIRSGSEFLPETHAFAGPVRADTRSLVLQQGAQKVSIKARTLLVANGLGDRFLHNEPGLEIKIAKHSRIGLSATARQIPEFYTPGIIYMACANGGYAGLVRLEDGELNIAAAIDPECVKNFHGPQHAVAKILTENNLPCSGDWETLSWHGTPKLTRRRLRLASERLFVLGDAAGYVEPFTGEGIAWALASAVNVIPLALESIRAWKPFLAERWGRVHQSQIGGRQHICRLLSEVLRKNFLRNAAVQFFSWQPSLAQPVIQWMH